MPIARIEYDLHDPDDSRAFKQATKAADMYLALFAISDRLRETVKYDKPPITRDEFYEILNSYNVDLDSLSF